MKKYTIEFSVTSKKLNTTLNSEMEMQSSSENMVQAFKEATILVNKLAPMFSGEVEFDVTNVKMNKVHTKPRKSKNEPAAPVTA
jgi:cytochrome c556